MPEVIETTVYTSEELDEWAKDKARDWYRESADESDLEATVEDFASICAILGVELNQKPVQLMGGGTRYDPAVYYQTSFSQSDFAAFDARYSYAKGSAKKLRAYAPQDSTLHAIVDALQEVQKRNGYLLYASATYHSYYGQQVEVDHRNGRDFTSDDEQEVKDQLRALARWFYDSLVKEVEYQSSEEVVDDNIICNGYTFTASGRRFG